MTQRLTHTLRYVSAAGDSEARWIRLEQEGADESVTVEQAAELIDTIFEIDSCEQGTGGGGNEEAAAPEEEQFDSAVSALMGDDLCAESEYWTAYVRVYRSHQSPDYVLRSATATVVAVEKGLTESVREIIESAGNSHDLEWPYAGGLVLPPGVRGEVRGSTLNLSRPAGRIVVRYTTIYDRVTLRVPVSAEFAQGEEGQALRAALDAAGLVAFQGQGATALAAAVALEPPAQDETLSADELARLCASRYRGVPRQGSCWQTIEHYRRCQCSDTEAPGSWTEEVATSCPEGVAAGAHLGTVRQFDGYTGCPGEGDEELSDREYYKSVCCEYPPDLQSLPRCRKTYSTYRGGAAIESGADYWRDIYGPDVRLVAVTPPDGNCGTLVHEWEVNRKSCCDDVTPMTPSPDNPETIEPGHVYDIGVRDGKQGVLFRWQLSGGLEFEPEGGTERMANSTVRVRAQSNICPQPVIRVDDGCYPLTMTFAGADSEGPTLDADDVQVQPYTTFALVASGGVPPYMWVASGALQIQGYSADGHTAYIRTPGRDEWCMETVTVVDQCGREARCDVYNAAAGLWDEVPKSEYDICSPPGAPYASYPRAYPKGTDVSKPKNGYYIRYVHCGNQEVECGTIPCGNLGTTCPCPAGNFVVDLQYVDNQCKNRIRISPECCYTNDGLCSGTTRRYRGNTYASYVSRLYRWRCS